MRTVELVNGIHSSALGFGCAPILGAVGAAKARRALECALDHGITHFDLARSYGYGEAEAFVGRVVKSRRNQLLLASKFGIRANWKAKFLRPLKPLVRAVRGNVKKTTGPESVPDVIRTAADLFHEPVPFRPAEMRASLEQSLNALQTDYLDYLLLHEPAATLQHIDELTSVAQQLKTEGKIRAWGIAYSRSHEAAHSAYLSRFDVRQFDNSFGSPSYAQTVIERGSEPNILFSPLRGGTHLPPAEKLSVLLTDFPKSVILCSMFSEAHIQANARLFQ